jgi:hypothetical protein
MRNYSVLLYYPIFLIVKEHDDETGVSSKIVLSIASDFLSSNIHAWWRLVEPRRIELLTSCLQSRRSPKLSYGPKFPKSTGGPEGNRTTDLVLIRDAL